MRYLIKNYCALVFILTFSVIAKAYPDFIGYGYSSCITCHYSGHGGGALTDYGRAVFATELTSQNLVYKNLDEDEIGKRSGFLMGKSLPWWFRPGLKYRGLWFQNNPGSESSKYEKFYNMQADINLNFFLDKKQTFAFISTFSYLETPRHFSTETEKNPSLWFMKEYYLRYQHNKNLWFYVGQMDKVFGIRQIDHTAVSRFALGLGQFDQSLGAIAHWAYPNWEISVNTFFGNKDESEGVKQKGLSVSGEYELAEKLKVGASFLTSKSDVTEFLRIAGHGRWGLSKGTSITAEAGLFQNKTENATSTPTGVYSIVQAMANIQKGYNFLSVIQYSASDLKSTAAERTSWALGALLFPLPRSEFRFMAVNGKFYDPSSGIQDSWQLQSQMHLSW
jgi:hypothetical protein